MRIVRVMKAAGRQGRWQKALTWLPFVAFLAVVVPLLVGCNATSQPSQSGLSNDGLVAQPAAVDLGNVPFDQRADARFTLVNQGTSVVHLAPDVQVQKLEGC